MEEIEVPTEHLHEEMHHQAEHSGASWISKVALASALLAVLAAVSALLAGDHANEAMVEQIQSSDQWTYYQAKGIKAAVINTKLDLLKSLGKEPSDSDLAKVKQYHDDQEEISKKAETKERSSENHLQHHIVFARAVTMFQVAIGIAAISVLTRRRRFFYVSLLFSAIGLVFLVQGLVMPAATARADAAAEAVSENH